jgi:adenylate cyclase
MGIVVLSCFAMKMSLMRDRLGAFLWSALVLAFLSALFSLTPLANRIENQYALQLLYLIRQPVKPPAGATIIALDKQTLDWLRHPEEEKERSELLRCLPDTVRTNLQQIRGPGSLPRAIHACLLERLKEIGFEVVVFDILFSVPGASEDDASLAKAFRDHGPVAILVGFERSLVKDGTSEILVEREVKPSKLFLDNAAATGAFVVPRSGGPVYGYWRVVPGFADTNSLPEIALKLSEEPSTRSAQEPTGIFKYLWLYGPPGTIETISARDFFESRAQDLRNNAGWSVAFVGASDPTATNYPDTFPSFFRSESGADISGVELLATAYLNLLHNQGVSRLSIGLSTILIMLFAAAFGVIIRVHPKRALISVTLLTFVYVGVSAFAFTRASLFLPVSTPLFFSAPAALILAVLVRYRFARMLIMHLAPKPVARRMLSRASDERGPTISGEATVVFFDLIGSTKIGEKISAVAFSELLNTYHETVTRAVSKYRGFVCAFSGDGVTALFTREDAGPDHATRACLSACSVVHELQVVNAVNASGGIPQLATRVGINSGIVAEGEMGASDRFNFSVVGDTVNLAARLEQLGKTLFPGEKDIILVGHSTKLMVSNIGMSFVNCGICVIPGREKPETVYRLRPTG